MYPSSLFNCITNPKSHIRLRNDKEVGTKIPTSFFTFGLLLLLIFHIEDSLLLQICYGGTIKGTHNQTQIVFPALDNANHFFNCVGFNQFQNCSRQSLQPWLQRPKHLIISSGLRTPPLTKSSTLSFQPWALRRACMVDWPH